MLTSIVVGWKVGTYVAPAVGAEVGAEVGSCVPSASTWTNDRFMGRRPYLLSDVGADVRGKGGTCTCTPWLDDAATAMSALSAAMATKAANTWTKMGDWRETIMLLCCYAACLWAAIRRLWNGCRRINKANSKDMPSPPRALHAAEQRFQKPEAAAHISKQSRVNRE